MHLKYIIICALLLALVSCQKPDVTSPKILVKIDPKPVHYRTEPYVDAGAEVVDDKTCNFDNLLVSNAVDIYHYGTYPVTYTAEDEAGNLAEAVRNVEIILPLNDYYSQNYNAFDTCTSGNYFYTALIQDCDCNQNVVYVANISNFGLSASFNLSVFGQYNQFLSLDTTKTGVSFNGIGTMNSGADTLFWDYIIQDTIATDVCRSTWIKE